MGKVCWTNLARITHRKRKVIFFFLFSHTCVVGYPPCLLCAGSREVRMSVSGMASALNGPQPVGNGHTVAGLALWIL